MPPGSDQIVQALPDVRRFAMQLTRSQTDADDLVQEVCEKALRKFHQWDARGSLKSWLFRIAHASWIDRVRRHKTSTDYVEAAKAFSPANQTDGAGHVERVLTLSSLEQAIKDLPEKQREALQLICFDGLSYQEAAIIADCPIGTLTSRLARARETLSSVSQGQRGKRVWAASKGELSG